MISSDESIPEWRSKKSCISITEWESDDSYKSFKDSVINTNHSIMRKYPTNRRKPYMIKRAKRTNETELEFCHHFQSNKKCSIPLSGVKRKKTCDVSVIQTLTERLKYPCVGLDRITEIQGLDRTHYYCEVCDIPSTFRDMLAHIESFQHRLESLKPLVPLIYENYSKQSRHEIENKLNKTIKKLAEMFGRGMIRVEKEYLNVNDLYSRRKKAWRKTGRQHSSNQIHYSSSSSSISVELTDDAESEFYKSIANSDIESRISGDHYSTNYNKKKRVLDNSNRDFSHNIHRLNENKQRMNYDRSFFHYGRVSNTPRFYCNICKMFINTKISWELHLVGDRHITNIRKDRGELPFRRKPVLVPNARAKLMNELDRIEEPVVGLDMMKETEDPDAPGPMYTCLLCLYNTTSIDIINHILSLKHRIKFLEKIRYPSLQAIMEKCKDKYSLYKVIRKISAHIEAKQGRGTLNVFLRSGKFDCGKYCIKPRKNRRED